MTLESCYVLAISVFIGWSTLQFDRDPRIDTESGDTRSFLGDNWDEIRMELTYSGFNVVLSSDYCSTTYPVRSTEYRLIPPISPRLLGTLSRWYWSLWSTCQVRVKSRSILFWSRLKKGLPWHKLSACLVVLLSHRGSKQVSCIIFLGKQKSRNLYPLTPFMSYFETPKKPHLPEPKSSGWIFLRPLST